MLREFDARHDGLTTRIVLRGPDVRTRDPMLQRGALGERFGSGRRLPETLALQNIVGHGVPSEHDGSLGDAAHGELPQAPLAEPGIDAFMDGTLAIGGLAGIARHAFAPGRDALFVVFAVYAHFASRSERKYYEEAATPLVGWLVQANTKLYSPDGWDSPAQVLIALDVAATHFYDPATATYRLFFGGVPPQDSSAMLARISPMSASP